MINKLGFGFLRLPKNGDELDWETINAMVDIFMEGGGTFFDKPPCPTASYMV